MFERFTERARQVVLFAQQSCRDHKHANIDTTHILDGLLRESEGLAARVLATFEITEDRWEPYLEPDGSGDPQGQIPFTPEAKRVLELALREALSLGHNYIGTEHILLGLMSMGVQAEANTYLAELRDKSIDEVVEEIRHEVIRMLSGPETRSNLKEWVAYSDRGARIYEAHTLHGAANAALQDGYAHCEIFEVGTGHRFSAVMKQEDE